MWIDQAFPRLAQEGYLITSQPDQNYNCIAYTAGDTGSWWSHLHGYRWPQANRTDHPDSLVEVFQVLGYQACDDGTPEPQFEKIALYAKEGAWTHTAIQMPDGAWRSKLGTEEDIQHSFPESIAGALYGTIHCFMRRPKPTT